MLKTGFNSFNSLRFSATKTVSTLFSFEGHEWQKKIRF